MKKTSLKEKTAKGLFWGGISNGVQQLIGAVFGIIIARILSPGDYGLIGMLAIFTAIANMIMEGGFSSALANKNEIKHEDYNAVFWFSLLAGVIIYALLFFCAPLIVRFYGKPALTTGLCRFIFLNIPVFGTAVAHHAIMFKTLMVKERAVIEIVSVSVSSLLGLTLALNGFAYWGLAIQNLSFAVIGVLLRWYYSPWKPTFTINFKPLPDMIGFSFKLFLTGIFWQISNNVFSVILGKFYNEKQVGYYSQGNKWMTLGSNVIEGMVNGVAQPVFVESKGNRERQVMIFRKMIRFGALISFPAILGLAFIGKEFILATVGEKWLESVPILQLLCIWGSIRYIWALYTFLLISHGKSDIYLYVNVTVCILQLACAAILFPFGILPMIGAYVACYFVGILMWHYFANKLLGIRLRHVLKDVLPYLLITAVCFFVAWIATREIQNPYLLCTLKVVIVAVLYVLIMKYSRSTIFRESMKFLLGYVKK